MRWLATFECVPGLTPRYKEIVCPKHAIMYRLGFDDLEPAEPHVDCASCVYDRLFREENRP